MLFSGHDGNVMDKKQQNINAVVDATFDFMSDLIDKSDLDAQSVEFVVFDILGRSIADQYGPAVLKNKFSYIYKTIVDEVKYRGKE